MRHWDWSETSQTVSLFCRERGLVRGLAKGAKRANGQFSGGIELLSRGEVLGVQKPTSELATLTAWDLRETYPVLRRSLRAFYAGQGMAGVAFVAVGPGDPHPLLFDSLVDGLGMLGDGTIDVAMARFLWAALSESGHRPEFSRYVDSDAALAKASSYRFSSARGGLVRDVPTQSSGMRAGASGLGVWGVRADTVKLLLTLEREGADGSGFSDETWARAARLLAAHSRRAFDRDIPALDTIYPDHTRAPRG